MVESNENVDLRKKLFEVLPKEEITIFELKKAENTLEDAFISLIEERKVDNISEKNKKEENVKIKNKNKKETNAKAEKIEKKKQEKNNKTDNKKQKEEGGKK